MRPFFRRWIWAMALRDARRGLKSILLSMICVVYSVAAVVAAFSFRDNVQSSIRAHSKSLLGADLALDSREPLAPDGESLMASLGGAQSRQIGFSSMAYFPASGGSRLVSVRAIGPGFPYYGVLETEPASASQDFLTGPQALIDETVMLQFGARVGDRVKIGDQEFQIAGKLRKVPGDSLTFSLLSPRVYVPLDYLDRSQVAQKGSLVGYRTYFKFDSSVNADDLVRRIGPELKRLDLGADTVSRRVDTIAYEMENLSRYLHLAVFIAVLLAGVGVASSVHVYTKEKTSSVAILRCVGAAPKDTVAIYLIQTILIAFAGSLLGVAVGLALQALLPIAFKDFLPVNAGISFSVKGILPGMLIGLGTNLLFALVPLIALRNVTPLLALRSSCETTEHRRDPVVGLIFLLIAAAILAFALATTARRLHALLFTAGVLIAFGWLALTARGIARLMRRFVPVSLPFAWRHGLANLYRPNNQTTAVMLAIGLGTFLLVTFYAAQSRLVNQVVARGGKGEPNLVIFDVQRDQRADLARLLGSLNIANYQEVPIVSMRLARLHGKNFDEIRAAKLGIPGWALRREYRSTYRRQLTGTEQLISGVWHGSVAPGTGPIPVSLEKGIAETLKVTIGDLLEFDVQGVSLATRVASLREVDWQRVQPNFFVVFPEGVLETAPQFYGMVTRTESSRLSAQLQRAVVERFPNVSIIDLTLVLTTLDSILGKVSGAIRFIALFILATGMAVVVSAVLASRSQRIKESILMKTLGAPRAQIVMAIVAEYLLLGTISCVSGACLGLAASWGLSFYFLGAASTFSWMPVLAILLSVTAATVGAGVIGCWGIFRRPALEALRAET